MRFDWQKASNEIRGLRTHSTKDFPHPLEARKRIRIQSGVLLHAYTDKGFQDIKKELPNYSFPEGKDMASLSSNYFIMNLPPWGKPQVEEGGKVVRVFDRKGVSIFRYSNPIVIGKGKTPYEVIDEEGNKVKDAFSKQDTLSPTERIVVSKAVDEATYEIENNKLYLKLPPTLKNTFPLQAYDATDTASTNNKDARINAEAGAVNKNYGASTGGHVFYSTYAMRLVMEWTLSSGSGTISEISLFLYIDAMDSCTQVNIHELTQAFIEGTGDGDVVEGVTWNDYNAGSWTSPGGDYDATIVDSLTPQAATNWDEYVLVGEGATNPISGLTWGNTIDLLLKLNSEASGTVYVVYNTKDAASDNPYIQITYTVGAYEIETTTNLSLSPSVSRMFASDRGISSNLSLAPSVSRVFGRLRTTSSNLSLAPSVSRALAYARATTSNLSLAATIAKVWGRTITTSVSLSLATTISRALAWTRATSSNLSLATSISIITGQEYLVEITTNLSLAVSVAKVWGRTIATSSALSLSASVTRVKGFVKATTSNLSLAPTISKAVAWGRATPSNLSLTVTVVRSWARIITTSASLSLTTTISRAVAWGRATSSALSLAATVLSWVAVGRQLVIKILTAQYRAIELSTSQHRIISAITALVRKIKILTLGD